MRGTSTFVFLEAAGGACSQFSLVVEEWTVGEDRMEFMSGLLMKIKTEYLNVYMTLKMHKWGLYEQMYLWREPGVVNLKRVFLWRHRWGGPRSVNGIDIIVTEEWWITYHKTGEIKDFLMNLNMCVWPDLGNTTECAYKRLVGRIFLMSDQKADY